MKNTMKLSLCSVLFIGSLVSGIGTDNLEAHASSNDESNKVALQVGNSFNDVAKNHYAYDAIEWGKNKGLISGYTDAKGKPNGVFGTNDDVTEAQFVKMVSNYLGLKDTAGNITKNKNQSTHWSDTYYDAMAKYGVPLNGYFDNTIRNKPMKRGSVAQALGYLLGDTVELSDSINYLLATGVTSGQNPQFEGKDLNKFFGTTNNLTRGQVITFLYRMDSKNLNNLSSLANMTSSDAASLNAKAKEGYSYIDVSLGGGKPNTVNYVPTEKPSVEESNGFTEDQHVGKLNIIFTPGQKGNDINEVKEIRKGYIADGHELRSELVFEDFKKDVNDKNKKIVENLDKSLDFKTGDFKTGDYRTFITTKDNTDKSILIYTANKSLGDKSEITYYDSSIWLDSVYYLESEENALRFHKMITDAGFNITKEELDTGVAKAIKNRGSDFYVIRNYKFIDAISYDYIKINKINE